MSKKEKVFPLNTFGGRIQDLRKNKLEISRPEFYDLIYPNGNVANESKSRTVKNWESGECEPDLETIKKLCIALKCSSDYLLGLDNCTTKDTQFIHDKTGLSEKAIGRITSKNGSTPKQDFLNSFILSEEYIEIEHSMSWIKNNCHNIKVYHPVFENIKVAIEKAEDQEEFYRLDDKLQEYANHLEHNGSQIQFLMYQCNLSFGNFLNNIRKSWGNEVCSILESLEKPPASLDSAKEYYKKMLDTN